MIQSNITRNNHLHKPVAKLIHLEIFLAEGSLDSFYTGFSGRIEDGGIFITTWQTLDQYTPVEVTIHFPTGQVIRPRGTVEWIREANPAISDTPPGIGVSFFELKPVERDLIDTWLISHPPVFLDNVSLEQPLVSAPSPDDIELETLPINIGPGCDLNEEHLFLSGLARDITHYLNERPMVVLNDRIAAHRRQLPPAAHELWTLKVLPYRNNQRFQGAFQHDDPEYRLFVETDAPVPVGTQLNMQLICESGVRVGCPGEVRWVRKRNPLVNHFNAPAGMGVVLKKIQPGTWHAINPDNIRLVHCAPL
ncbi:MAG: hypothetical protein JXX14_20865 [Deltaproteobacteria bacterium]|nr:hypothetical protein [Deltaproteobacteria bacterium]